MKQFASILLRSLFKALLSLAFMGIFLAPAIWGDGGLVISAACIVFLVAYSVRLILLS